jgi:hypothetical protein
MAADEAMRKDAAAKVPPKLLLDVVRQRALIGLAGVSEKRLEVLAYRPVEH